MNETGKSNKTITENFFEYLRYHPISSKLQILFFVGCLGILIASFLFPNISSFMSFPIWIVYFFLMWLPIVPIALKTRSKYAISLAIAIIGFLLLFILLSVIQYLFPDIISAIISKAIILMTREQPLFGALLITAVIVGFFGLWMKYSKSEFGIQDVWIQKGGVIGNAASQIYSTQDGYSERPYSYQMKISGLNFSDIENFAKFLAKNLIIINWKNRENSVKMWLFVTRSFISYFDIFYSKNENLGTWIEINKEGKIIVFIAKPDYKNIYREVTYHTLCKNLAEKFEQSFIEFAKGSKDDKINSVKILKGEK